MPSKAADLARLAEIATELEYHDELYAERIVIWDRRHRAGDVSDSALGRAANVARSQVLKGLKPERVEAAKALMRQVARRRREASAES